MSETETTSSNFSSTNPGNLSPLEISEIESRSFREGVRDAAPTLIGIAAWGLVTGVAMMKSHFTVMQAMGMTLFVFAGSAQLAALPLIVSGAPIWVIFISGLMVNLRFVIFSVIIAPHFTQLKLWQKTLWGYLTGDVSIIYFMRRYPTEKPEIGKLAYTKGLFVPNWAAWQLGSVLGILLGNSIPEDWDVGFAGTLAVLCVLLPMIVGRAALLGVIVSGAMGVATWHWPYKLGMLLAVVAGMLSAIAYQEYLDRRARPTTSKATP